MSTLASLISGADCGPINPLQGLAKRFDADRGASQDQFRSARAGSSREVFRSQPAQASAELAKEATDFFQGSLRSSTISPAPSPFDLSSLNAALHAHPIARSRVPTPSTAFSPSPSANFASGWAKDFASQAAVTVGPSSASAWAGDFLKQGSPSPSTMHAASMQTPPAYQGPILQRPQFNLAMSNPGFMQAMPPLPMNDQPQWTQPLQTPPHTSNDIASWASHFSQLDTQLMDTAPPASSELVVDDLSAVAGLLVDNLKDESNEKFKNSAFLGFMRQVRDKELVVDGNEFVPSSSMSAVDSQQQSSIPSSLKGKGVLRDPSSSTDQPVLLERRKSVHFESGGSFMDDWDTQQGEEVQREASSSSRQATGPNYFALQEAEWANLQQDWDAWDATVNGYQRMGLPDSDSQFAEGERARRMYTEHQAAHRSVLEKEDAVQRAPQDAQAWLDLGVKQQENEREHKAIEALTRALELDQTLLPAWLALAISHSNEGSRQDVYRTIREWIKQNSDYAAVSSKYQLESEEESWNNLKAMKEQVIACLLEMANTQTDAGLDADVQVALAVVLSTSEDYERAEDCFKLALELRPDDWQLYNRVGATLANSGKAADALPYYYRALELNQGYIRARYNVAISCVHLQRYEEAASHLLDALLLQETDAVQSDLTARGVTSSALWDSLRTTFNQLQRSDLAALCDKRDLPGIQAEFSKRSDPWKGMFALHFE